MLGRLLALALFAVPAVAAAETVDVLYLKNGSVIRGEVIELRPDVEVKIRTADGSVFVFEMSAVDHLEKQEAFAPKASTSSASSSSAFRVHSLVAGIAFTLVWGATVITTFALNDYYWPTTIIPVFGTLITMIRISSDPGASFYPGALPLSILSTVAQIGLCAYLIAGLFIPPASDKAGDSPRAMLVPSGNGVALVGRF